MPASFTEAPFTVLALWPSSVACMPCTDTSCCALIFTLPPASRVISPWLSIFTLPEAFKKAVALGDLNRDGRLDHRPDATGAAVAFLDVRHPAQVVPEVETSRHA